MSSDLTTQPPAPPETPLTPANTTNQGRALTKAGIAHNTSDDLWKTAQMLVKTGMVPKSYQGKPELAFAAMITGIELGYTPAASLRCIAVVNGTPSVWGTGGYALAMNHELYDRHEVTYQMPGENETDLEPELPADLDKVPDGFRVICRAYRKGQPKPFIAKFSVADAKRAKLWGMTASSGAGMPWTYYFVRMMMHKAIGNALESAFPEAYFNIGKDLDGEAQPTEPAKPDQSTLPTGTGYLKTPKTKVAAKPEPSPQVKEVLDQAETMAQQMTKQEAIDGLGEVLGVETTKTEPEKAPAPEQATTDKAAKKISTKQIMNQFSKEFPKHERAKLTTKDKAQFMRCECGAVYTVLVDELADIPVSFIMHASSKPDGSCTAPPVTITGQDEVTEESIPLTKEEPKEAPKKEKLTSDPADDEMLNQIASLDSTTLNQFFEEKIKESGKANLGERRKAVKPIAAMLRRRFELCTSIVHVSQASQWMSRANFVISMDGELLGKLKEELAAKQNEIKTAQQG